MLEDCGYVVLVQRLANLFRDGLGRQEGSVVHDDVRCRAEVLPGRVAVGHLDPDERVTVPRNVVDTPRYAARSPDEGRADVAAVVVVAEIVDKDQLTRHAEMSDPA